MKFHLLFLSLALTAPLAATVQPASPLFTQTDIFQQGENGVHTYRIPALVETLKGTLIAVADARQNSSRDLPNQISLAMRRSFDQGKTWEPIRTILAVGEGGVGDASLMLDRTTGRVWCFHNYGPPGIGFWTAKPGAVTGPTTHQVHAMYSDDDGATWSEPVDITPQIKDPAWQAMFAASGTDIQLASGRLLMPLVIRDAKGIIHSANAYSDDHGKTWKAGAFIGDHTDESHNVQLKDGEVMQNMRDGKTREIARSKDGGATFGPVTPDAALIDPSCNAGITHYDFANTDALVFTNAASAKRQNLTVKISYDEGQTWPIAHVINPGPSAYSTVIQLHDGTLAVLYERGDNDAYERITFARFNLAWATNK